MSKRLNLVGEEEKQKKSQLFEWEICLFRIWFVTLRCKKLSRLFLLVVRASMSGRNSTLKTESNLNHDLETSYEKRNRK